MTGDAVRRPEPTAAVPLPGTVIALGMVSLFMDISSEMIHSTLPLFLVSVLGVSSLSVGIIEGVAEATASITKIFAGAASDWMRRRKPLLLLGYGLSALTKPLFPLANGIALVLTARIADRVGKGIRGAPRDALVADLTAEASRGAAYGLRQSLDTVGAFAGPAFALALMALTGDAYRTVFWVAVLPSIASVAVIVIWVREPPAAAAHDGRLPLRSADIGRLPRRYWFVLGLGAVLTLARFSEAFLLLRARDVGLAETYAPLVLIVMNVVYAASAYPIGRLSDRGQRGVLTLGVVFLIAADLALAAAHRLSWVLAGTALWGLHMGATQSLLAALVAATAPAGLRGTAFGLFNLVSGIALLIASLLAGWLWAALGPPATFLTGALFSATALVGLLAIGEAHPADPLTP